jgi:Domain of unknown function (DUF4296)
MKFSFKLLFLLILFFSCSHKPQKASILPEKKMKEVMWDMIRADQYVSGFLLKDSTKKKKEESVKLYEEIFHIHGITKEQFKKSLDYYSSQPDLFRPIIDSLGKRKNSFSSPSGYPVPPQPVDKLNKDSAAKSAIEKHPLK